MGEVYYDGNAGEIRFGAEGSGSLFRMLDSGKNLRGDRFAVRAFKGYLHGADMVAAFHRDHPVCIGAVFRVCGVVVHVPIPVSRIFKDFQGRHFLLKLFLYLIERIVCVDLLWNYRDVLSRRLGDCRTARLLFPIRRDGILAAPSSPNGLPFRAG